MLKIYVFIITVIAIGAAHSATGLYLLQESRVLSGSLTLRKLQVFVFVLVRFWVLRKFVRATAVENKTQKLAEFWFKTEQGLV